MEILFIIVGILLSFTSTYLMGRIYFSHNELIKVYKKIIIF